MGLILGQLWRVPWWAWALMLLGFGGWARSCDAPSPQADPRLPPDTVEVVPGGLGALIREYQIRHTRLDRLRAVEDRAPVRVVREAQPTVEPPDSVAVAVHQTADAELVVEVLWRSAGDTLATRVVLDRIPVAGCDDGWSLDALGRLVCDRPALGLWSGWVGAAGGVAADVSGSRPILAPSLALEWKRHLRSPWTFRLEGELVSPLDLARAQLRVERRIFGR